MDYIIRKIKETEYGVLNDFLYEAIFIPDGVEPPPREIINQPELRVYTENFGKRAGDNCFVAEINNVIAGAVWVRIMNDYGHIDNDTPSYDFYLKNQFNELTAHVSLYKKLSCRAKTCSKSGMGKKNNEKRI